MKIYHLLLSAVVVISLYSIRSFAQSPTLQISPESVSVGEKAEITWNAPVTGNVYISQIGIVEPQGKLVITGKETKNILLVIEKDDKLYFTEKTLTVTGAKGFDDYPDQNNFKSSNSLNLEAKSINNLLDKIKMILQDSMYFNIQMYSLDSNTVRIITNLKEKNTLKSKDEKKIGKRRLAYMVELTKIYSQINKYECKIFVFIEYQNKIENTWRHETNEDLYHTQVDLLKQKIK